MDGRRTEFPSQGQSIQDAPAVRPLDTWLHVMQHLFHQRPRPRGGRRNRPQVHGSSRLVQLLTRGTTRPDGGAAAAVDPGRASPRDEDDNESSMEGAVASRERLIMAVHHMTAFCWIFYGLYALCRFGFGWDPIRDPPPATYTIEIPGLTTTTTTAITITTTTTTLTEAHSRLLGGK